MKIIHPIGRLLRLFCYLLLAVLNIGISGTLLAVEPLWQIGKTDRNDLEFALAPGNYSQYEADGFFVVGVSHPKQDWPYVHPGPNDTWAGSRAHTFTIVFGLRKPPAIGDCMLVIEVLDPHGKSQPKLGITVNGQRFERTLPAGGGDASVRGNLSGIKPTAVTVTFPVSLLKAGNNQVHIENYSGSWLLYDSVAMTTPAAVQLAPVANFTAVGTANLEPMLRQKEGKHQRQLKVPVLHVGQTEATVLRLDGNELSRFSLETGRQTVAAAVPTPTKARLATLTVTTGKRTISSQTLTLAPGVSEIIIVFKTHFDIGYTDMASNIVQKYRTTMIDDALKVVEQNRDLPPAQQFVWTIPGWPMHKILEDWPGQTQQRKSQLLAAFTDGRFVVHGLPFTTHTELLEPEDLTRGLGYSARLTRKLNLPLPRDAKMTDVPEHSAILPTVLHHAGIEFMHIGCNGLSSPLQVPSLFWWEGPDGSRVLTMYSPSYGTGLIPPPNWPYKTWLALIHTGDNHGPPRPEEVQKVFAQAGQRMPGVKVRIGRLSDFADAVRLEKPDLPVVRGDAPDTWIHGPMSDPVGASVARTTRPLISATEVLNTQLRIWGVQVPDATPAVTAAYEQSLLYGEHTWGGSIGWIRGPLTFFDVFKQDRAKGRFQRNEDSWDEHTSYIMAAKALTLPALQTSLQGLADNVRAQGPRIVVYNPLPWKRDGVVSLPEGLAPIPTVSSVEGDQVAAVDTSAGRQNFVARAIPPMGYSTYVPLQTQMASAWGVDEQHATFSSPALRVTLDPARGTIRSLIFTRSGRELADPGSATGLGQFLYERFDQKQVWAYCDAYNREGRKRHVDFDKPGLPSADEHPYRSASPTNFNLRFEQGANQVTAIMEAPASIPVPCGVTTRVTLYRDLPWLDLEITLRDKPMEPWPEAGWLCLPFRINEPQFRLGRLGTIFDPAKDIIPGANRDIFGLNNGLVMMNAKGRGVGICPLDHPLVSLGEPGCWKYTTSFALRKPVAFLNLFNNQWNTNFRLWNSGTWTSRVRIWPVDHYQTEASLITPSLEARYPLLAGVSGLSAMGNREAVKVNEGGILPPLQHGVELSRKGVVITTYGNNPDGPGKLLRLWEYAGKSGSVTVRFPEGMRAQQVQPVNLRGVPAGKTIPLRHQTFSVSLKAFAPASFTWVEGDGELPGTER